MRMPAHAHRWSFTFAPGRWTAMCGCGLAVTVAELDAGRSTWSWTRHGTIPPSEVLLAGVGSVTQARQELLAGMAMGGN